MITTRTWIMTITEMLCSSVIVFLTIASCVAGAPLQLEDENIGLGQAIYSQPELAAALVRSYEALESQEKNDENEISIRNLDHIGGGNLLRNLDHSAGENLLRHVNNENNERDNEFERNLDHIGGGNLLRNLNSQRFLTSKVVQGGQGNKPGTIRTSSLAERFKNDLSKWNAGRRMLDPIGGRNIIGRRDDDSFNELERNLDRIGGGNLLRDLNSETFGRSSLIKDQQSINHRQQYQRGSTIRPDMAEKFEVNPSKWAPNRATLDCRLGSGNSLGREPDPRAVSVIGGGHLMRQSRRGLDSLSGATFGESKRWDPPRKPNEPSTQKSHWPNIMNRIPFDSSAKRNFDEIDRTNLDSFVKRNLDEIDRTGWDSFVKRRSINTYLASRQR